MRDTGLKLQTVWRRGGSLRRTTVTPSVWGTYLQPDLVLVSRSLLLDLCRPFDSHSELLAAARQR
jgi:hypothetical protein